VLVHLFDALAQLAFGKLSHARSEHLFVFGKSGQGLMNGLLNGFLTLAHLRLSQEKFDDWF
jgi:hypothetical protein